ncbi:MAG: antitoxin [Spirochaetaceae bacterium]|nr:MAG: antitoxin [Spirochaetaceae bacterium]
MKRSRSDFERLLAELNTDVRDLNLVVAENARAWKRIEHGATDSLDWAALGYTIHNVYGVMENYCVRVAKFFENGLEGESWHRELLRRMTLDIPTIRPALLTEETCALVDELRSFRHLFRNLYARPLDPDRTRLVQGKVGPATDAFVDAHRGFAAKMQQIASALDDIE